MNGIILYKSKYGATKKYADWLSEETGFRCVDTDKANQHDIAGCDTVILGGGIYASGIAGLAFLKKNIDQLSGKKLIVFCVGASPYNEAAFHEIVEHNMKDKLKNIPVFYCRGAWDIDSMSLMDKTLCKMLRKSVAKKDPSELEPWMTALISAGDEKCDWTDKAYLKPILDTLRKE
ncbi:MAG: flavodoxin domain-containing protein [Oscillospiraceae bacterium]|nr:flavodoxin domain-containing protein [Oscillospiraceae bacterium]